jgi:hypothetical protein
MSRVTPLESVTPVMVQLLSPPKLKYLGVWSVKSITPKSGIEEDVEGLGDFEQPVINTAIKAAVVIMCGMRIKCE